VFRSAGFQDCEFVNANFEGADLSKIFYDENTKWPEGIGTITKEEKKSLTFQEELVMLLNKHGLKLSEPVKLETLFP
jgi:hypothetical protein